MNIEERYVDKPGDQALLETYNNLMSTEQFSWATAPDLCQQLYYWQITRAIILAVLLTVSLAATIMLLRQNLNDIESEGWQIFLGATRGLGTVITAILLWFSLTYAITAIKATVAPKVFLMETISNMIRS